MLKLNNRERHYMTTDLKTLVDRAHLVDEIHDEYKKDMKHMTMYTFISFETWFMLYTKDYDAMALRMARLRGDHD